LGEEGIEIGFCCGQDVVWVEVGEVGDGVGERGLVCWYWSCYLRRRLGLFLRLLEISVIELAKIIVLVAFFKVVKIIAKVVASFLLFLTISSKTRARRRFLDSRGRLPS
jgi:hypothetical protein